MNTCHILLVFLAALALVHASADGKTKSAELRNLILQDPNGVVTLNASGYKHYVAETPRPYDVVIYFTSDNCKLCDQIYLEYVQVAKLFRENGASWPSRSGRDRKRSVFFAKMNFNENTREIFTKFNFNSVPNILVSLPKMASIASPEALQAYTKEFLWMMSVTDGVITSHKLLEYTNKKTGRNVEYREPIINLFIVLAILGLIGFAGFTVVTTFKDFFGSPKVWYIASLFVYFVCMSGIVYNIIHNIPFTSVDRHGNMEWMASGFRTQLGLEGYIMSGSITLAGVLLVSLLKQSNTENRSSARFFGLVFGLAFIVVVFYIEGIYAKKTHHYNPEFWPPPHYIKGPVMLDQGFSLIEMPKGE